MHAWVCWTLSGSHAKNICYLPKKLQNVAAKFTISEQVEYAPWSLWKIRKVRFAIFLLHTEHEVDSVLNFHKELKVKLTTQCTQSTIILVVHIHIVYALCVHFNNLWIDMYITISRCGTCFGMVGHVQQSVSSVRIVKSTLKEFEEVSKVSNTAPKVRIWSFLKTASHFFVLLASATLFRTHRFRHRLHGVVVAFWLSVFASVFVPVF